MQINQRKRPSEIRLPRFGSIIGLLFENGGEAEMLMTFPEIRRLLQAWREQELNRPDRKTLSALDVLCKTTFNVGTRFVAEVPIAARRAKITPVFAESEREAVEPSRKPARTSRAATAGSQ